LNYYKIQPAPEVPLSAETPELPVWFHYFQVVQCIASKQFPALQVHLVGLNFGDVLIIQNRDLHNTE
jgi:hypothetical protein